MAKKKSNVSINALERFCKAGAEDVMQRNVTAADGTEISFEVKKRLSFQECAQFVEDVVSECVIPSDLLVIPISKDGLIKRGLMTYYANFTMPASTVKACELVAASGDIIEDILSVIDNEQYFSILNAITERIDFEKQMMICTQKKKVDALLDEIAKFTEKMASLFDGVNGEQMAAFVSKMSQLTDLTNISQKEFASVLVEAATEKK